MFTPTSPPQTFQVTVGLGRTLEIEGWSGLSSVGVSLRGGALRVQVGQLSYFNVEGNGNMDGAGLLVGSMELKPNQGEYLIRDSFVTELTLPMGGSGTLNVDAVDVDRFTWIPVDIRGLFRDCRFGRIGDYYANPHNLETEGSAPWVNAQPLRFEKSIAVGSRRSGWPASG